MDDDGDSSSFGRTRRPFDEDVLAQRFNAAGAPQASEFLASMHTAFVQDYPAVAMHANGAFVVTRGPTTTKTAIPSGSWHSGSALRVRVSKRVPPSTH